MTTKLHADIKALAGPDAAIVLTRQAIAALLSDHIMRTAQSITNHSVPIEGMKQLSVRFTGVAFPVPGHVRPPSGFSVSLSGAGPILRAAIKPQFVANLSVHPTGDPTAELCTIALNVTNLAVNISALAPNIVFDNPDFDVSGYVAPSADQSQILKKAGIAPKELAAVEGALAYVMARRTVAAVLSTINTINLAERFTAFELLGTWKIQSVDGGIVVIPSHGIRMRDPDACALRDGATAIDGAVQPGPATPVNQGQVSWPFPAFPARTVVHGKMRESDGFAAIYAPRAIWEARFGNITPAVVYRESSPAFFGWDLTIPIEATFLDLSFDTVNKGLVVRFTVEAQGVANFTIDVPCDGREILATAQFTLGPSTVEAFLTFDLAEPGALVLNSDLTVLSLGDIRANILSLSQWTMLLGGDGVVVDLVLNYVLGRVVRDHIPRRLQSTVEDIINSSNMQLLDLEPLAQYTRRSFEIATVSIDTDSVLVGLGFE